MDRVTVGDGTFELPSLLHREVSPKPVTEPIETIVSFPEWMMRKFTRVLPGTGIIGLVGPPGTGKRTAIKQASTIPVHEYVLNKSLERGDIQQLISHLQSTLEGKCVWVLNPAALLDEQLVREMAKRTWPTRVVLVSNQKIWGLDNNCVIHHNIDAFSTFARDVAVQIGATHEQLQACGGDLRQLQLAKRCGENWMGGRHDKKGHPYFDTMAILNGMPRAPSYYNKAWLEQNILASTNDLDACAKFYYLLTFMDDHRWIPGRGGCKEDFQSDDGNMMSLSLGDSNRAPNKLETPHSTYVHDVAATDNCMTYKAFKNKMKRKAAYLEGDDATAQLTKANQLYLETMVGPVIADEDEVVPRRNRKRQRTIDAACPMLEVRSPVKEQRPELGSASSTDIPMNDTMAEPASSAASAFPVESEDDEMHLISGYPEYDLLGGYGMYRTNLRKYHANATPSTFPAYIVAPADLRNSKWLVISYSRDVPLELIIEVLEVNLPCCLIDAVSTDDANLTFVYKPSQQNIRSRLKVGTLEPLKVQVAGMCKGTGRSQVKNAQKDLITHFQQLPGKHITNMHMGKASEVEEYTAKTLLHAVKDMTAEAFTNFVLDARLKEDNGEERSELERLLCNDRIESRVRDLRKLSSTVVTNVVYAAKVKETGQVQPEKVFKNTWKQLRVTIHDKSLLTPLMAREGNKVTLDTFLKFPELHQNVTLFIPGESRTGKTELAKFICLLLAVKYQKEGPRFLMTNTLDSLRTNQALMLPGVPVLLDDIGGDDNDQQLIYSSISMWKAILQVKDATQNRARNDDLMWASRQPKVMTSNCMTLDDWIGVMFPRAKPSHKQAIVLRTAEVQTITDTLYSNLSAPSGSASFLPSKMSTEAASESIASLFE
jgi:hypothetical protein